MESWRCVSGENEFMSEETNVCGHPLGGSKHSSFAWDSRNPCNFSSNPFSTHQQIQNQGFGGSGSLEMIGKQELDCSIFDALSSKAQNGRTPNPSMSSSTPFHKLSASVAESNSRDCPFIDLKLGRFADQWDARCNKFSKENQLFSSSESSTPSKRVRASPVHSQPAFCQVLGCNKDLSSSKDYHKRHKVCDIHSKTATVIVNGIEQRFCQQCSRFHLLDAFDDGKRSCRKRLAGHNERRRKPQVGVHSGRSGRLLPAAYHGVIGSKFLGGGSNGVFLHPPAMDANLHSKSFFSPCNIETQLTPLTGGGTIFNDAGSHYPSIGGLNLMGTHEFDVFDAVSTVRSTGSALSLLSAQSRPWLVPMGQTSGVSNNISSSSAEGFQLCTVLSSDDGDAVNFEIVDGIFHGSSSSNGKDRVSSESGPTMNFLQLSSQLQRLEHQGKSMGLKRENNAVCCLRIT